MLTFRRLHSSAHDPCKISFWNGAATLLLASAVLAAGNAPSQAQVLARPGLAGSGVTLEPWWKRAVFYRIQPELFQDSDGDGHGDVAGIALRLNYLQSLDIDAIILKPSAASLEQDFNSFDGLARQASGARIRVLVEIGAPAAPPHDTDADYLAAARSWLTQGAAGLFVDTPALAKATGDERATRLLHDLRSLTSSFPGERLLLAAAPGDEHTALFKPLAQYTQLTAAPPLVALTGAKPMDAAPLRTQLETALGVPSEPAAAPPDSAETPRTTGATGMPHRRRTVAASTSTTSTAKPALPSANLNPLLSAAPIAASSTLELEQRTTLEASLAAMLLGSRAAVILNAGEEIGLSPLATGTRGTTPVMQWTPSNLTPKPKPPEPAETESTDKPAPTPAPPADPNVYGAFSPYVPPAPVKRKQPKPADDAAPPPVDPSTLAGFTAGELPAGLTEDAALTAKVNVTTEDADPNSLLNFYRKLIQYHHGNPTLHSGVEYVFNHDTLNAVTWMRRAQAGTARSPAILGVCNLSDKPLALSISDDLRHLQIRPGSFRTLVTSSSRQIFPQAYDHISLPPYTVFLGEMYH